MRINLPNKPKTSVLKIIQKFIHSNWITFGVPLLIAAALGYNTPETGFFFLIFCLLVWIFLVFLKKAVEFTEKLYPENISSYSKEKLQESISATLFLGLLALIGVVLRGNNGVSRILLEHTPEGVSVGFIDPFFAVIFILGIWLYTIYCIRK